MQSVEMLSMALAQTDNLYAQVLELWKMYSRKWAALSIELALIRVLSNREQSSCGSIDEADRIRGTEGTSRNFIWVASLLAQPRRPSLCTARAHKRVDPPSYFKDRFKKTTIEQHSTERGAFSSSDSFWQFGFQATCCTLSWVFKPELFGSPSHSDGQR